MDGAADAGRRPVFRGVLPGGGMFLSLSLFYDVYLCIYLIIISINIICIIMFVFVVNVYLFFLCWILPGGCARAAFESSAFSDRVGAMRWFLYIISYYTIAY